MSRFCFHALEALDRCGELDVGAFAVTWRRRSVLPGHLPAHVRVCGRPMPARAVNMAWRHIPLPSIEWFIGPVEVVHGTNFLVPPTRRAMRVVTVHDLTAVWYPEMCQPQSLAYPQEIRRAVADGAWIHTPSRFVADEVVSVFGADRSRVRAVAHGIPALPLPPSGVEASPPPLDLPEGIGRTIVAIGTIEPRKDMSGLVVAFDRIADGRGDVALVIAGPDGWGAASFEETLAASPNRNRIIRTGYLDDGALGRVLAGASLLAYPSRYEGFGFPPLQAMAVGVPVVTTTAGAIPEVVGDAAALVPPGDADSLAGAMAEVLDDPRRSDELTSAGRRRAAQFSWDRCAEGLAALYRDAMNRH